MLRESRLHIDWCIPPLVFMGGFVGILILVCPIELGSENVTLTTYYPAPSGVYTRMITTSATFLARDGGSVGIGNAAPAQKLDVTGNMRMNSNNVAGLISGVNPGNFGGKQLRLTVNDGAGGANDEIWIGPNVAGGAPQGHIQMVSNDIRMIGSTRVTGAGATRGYLYIDNTNTGCSAASISGNAVVCAAGQYATFTPGIYIEGTSLSDRGNPAVAMDLTGTTNTQVWGLNRNTGATSWMVIAQNSSLTNFYCCPK